MSWTETTIGEIATVVGGGTPSTQVAAYWGGSIPWFTPAEIPESGAGVVTASERSITETGLAKSAAKLLPPGAVLVTSRASIGNCAIAGVPVSTNQGFSSLVPKDARSTRFLYYWVQQHRVRFLSRSAGSTFLEINASKVREIDIVAPTTPEQVAIGEAIVAADDLIVTLGRLIAKKRAIKEGMMQQLLTGRTRLPGFDSEWRTRRIGEFTQVRAGGTPSTSVVRYWGGSIRWMSSGEIHGKRITEVAGRITEMGLRESAAQLLPAGTVLMALAGQGKTRGTVAVSRVDLSTNQSIAGILPSVEHDPDFLFYNLDKRYAELRGESSGDGGRGGLNLTIIKNLDVLMPELAEQQAISTALGAIDDELGALDRRLTKAHAIKQGMMQQLLTGRTRLPVEDTV
ncbi:restriction endonuclease subunit S [Kocuria palustris]|uniref:restriction endonuclease subunit S n=1 Tax=Kocuria palustris TaxID=71999 RepID=UPI0035DD8926